MIVNEARMIRINDLVKAQEKQQNKEHLAHQQKEKVEKQSAKYQNTIATIKNFFDKGNSK